MSKVYTVCTFGSTNWTAAETSAKVKGKQRISRGVYAHPETAAAVAQHAVGMGSCTAAKVAVCDNADAAANADISLSGGTDWKWIAE